MNAGIVTFPNHPPAVRLRGSPDLLVVLQETRSLIARSCRMSPRIILPALGASVCLSLTLLFASVIVS